MHVLHVSQVKCKSIFSIFLLTLVVIHLRLLNFCNIGIFAGQVNMFCDVFSCHLGFQKRGRGERAGWWNGETGKQVCLSLYHLPSPLFYSFQASHTLPTQYGTLNTAEYSALAHPKNMPAMQAIRLQTCVLYQTLISPTTFNDTYK